MENSMSTTAELNWIEHHFSVPRDTPVIVQRQGGRRVAVIPSTMAVLFWPHDGSWSVTVRGMVQRADGTRGRQSRSVAWRTGSKQSSWQRPISEAPDWVKAALEEARG
jgi:hypothetical protein